MQKLHFSIVINAPKEKVWHAMLDDKQYREWTGAFNPGSYSEDEYAEMFNKMWPEGLKKLKTIAEV